ncbi:MAG: S-methyl-5-thioribose-1-phosphate isomerase [Victivallales bacterium]|nr:S-methyl-5-thioribose-1-phosphate isomerase [Victivallales bacterium]
MLDPVSWKLDSGRVIRAFEPDIDDYRGKLRIIDQTLLPEQLEYIETCDVKEVYACIKRLAVRGAPAIGCAAALGLAAGAFRVVTADKEKFLNTVKGFADELASSRPTAVNLFWALNRCTAKLCASAADDGSVDTLKIILLHEALDILAEDINMCRTIGEYGLSLLREGAGILTHCNAGALATGDYGTALSPMYAAHERGMKFTVYSDETRPLLQGSRLTAWELSQVGIDVVSICDNMAAQVMKEGKIDLVIVGSDRIAANGDAANKIGTYGVAVLAKYHHIPFYVAAPYSTVDITLEHGGLIPIEQRDGDEIRRGFGKLTAPEKVKVYNPAFDVTPHELISGIITERGILTPPFSHKLKEIIKS